MSFYEIHAYVLDLVVLSSSVYFPREIKEENMKDNRVTLNKHAHSKLLYLLNYLIILYIFNVPPSFQDVGVPDIGDPVWNPKK